METEIIKGKYGWSSHYYFASAILRGSKYAEVGYPQKGARISWQCPTERQQGYPEGIHSWKSSVQQALRSLRGEATVFLYRRYTGDKLVVKDVCLFERSHKLI